jgi:SpoVK/Ycf46/Vps4 family AAA+-type ATPase
VSRALRRLGELGLVEVGNPAAPRGEWSLQIATAVWEALAGHRVARPAPWAAYTPPEALPPLDSLLLPGEVAGRAAALVRLVGGDGVQPVLVRGPAASGRATLVAALARELGRGLLEIDEPERLAGVAGPLATLLDAVPVVTAPRRPDEPLALAPVDGYAGPLAIVAGRQGTVEGSLADDAITLDLGVPPVELRTLHWAAALGTHAPADIVGLGGAWRLPAGTIHRAGRQAAAEADLAGRARVAPADVRAALRRLQGPGLSLLATRVEADGDWNDLAAGETTLRELALLELRCRHRETLGAAAGVRALFSGPSGTGKTLSARLLAGVLGKDLYVVDLASVVDKYLGETEKNLDEVLTRAEEIDAVLLLDEGDALLGRRTEVRAANDRYANLETNFLLQRLEAFEGIVVVTTNAGDRLDPAFRRRIDVVVEFRAPDPPERWLLWTLHLPPDHGVDAALLDEVAGRCALTGGQIRNAALHAALLAVEHGGEVDGGDLDAAVRREYRKAGAACPLRVPGGARA